MANHYNHDIKGQTLPLTDRQKGIVQLLADGLVNKEIAYRMKISEGTIKNHVQDIKERLGGMSRANIVAIALRDGIIEFPRETGEPARRLLFR